jgi:ubiquinone/menaquinone biosynthesis C-methylase UbiE
VRVTVIEGHRIWAPSYDAGLNPLLALETRVLLDKLGPFEGCRFLDVACGTGRWMQLARERGARVFGTDLCPEMLQRASRKASLCGKLCLADVCRVPFGDGMADFTFCSFALGYVASPVRAIAEMARVTRQGARVVITDLHPSALAAGWTRSFRADGEVYEIDHHSHSAVAWEEAAGSAGLMLDWRIDANFAEPEREIFRQAGKDSQFSELSAIPAVLAMCWIKS